jgi:hypothetical protein
VSVEQWEPALVAIERCLSLRYAVIPVRHPDTLAALKLMGHIAQQVRDVALAEDCLLKAAQAAEQVWGPQNLAFATYANDLGVFYYALENGKPTGTPRDLSKMQIGQCLYVPMVDETGGMLNDPVAVKLDEDRFWISIADSDLLLWVKGIAWALRASTAALMDVGRKSAAVSA